MVLFSCGALAHDGFRIAAGPGAFGQCWERCEVNVGRVGLGQCRTGIVLVPEVEGLLAGSTLTRELLEASEAAVRARLTPIDDVRASAGYRRTVACNLLLRLSERVRAASGELQR